eukprot:m.11438 g.11438  ORF g.11438 m.11438 type:complete len:73 (-) comp6919_c0_seq1:262-480(-)
MSAIFNLTSLIQVILLLICACSYARSYAPTYFDKLRGGPFGLFWGLARIGDRLSQYVALACFVMAAGIIYSS